MALPSILMSGNLWKSPPQDQFIFRKKASWKNRYFVLRDFGYQCLLEYYESESHYVTNQPLGIISMSSVENIEVNPEQNPKWSAVKTMMLHDPGDAVLFFQVYKRQYFLVGSRRDIDKWMQKLKEVRAPLHPIRYNEDTKDNGIGILSKPSNQSFPTWSMDKLRIDKEFAAGQPEHTKSSSPMQASAAAEQHTSPGQSWKVSDCYRQMKKDQTAQLITVKVNRNDVLDNMSFSEYNGRIYILLIMEASEIKELHFGDEILAVNDLRPRNAGDIKRFTSQSIKEEVAVSVRRVPQAVILQLKRQRQNDPWDLRVEGAKVLSINPDMIVDKTKQEDISFDGKLGDFWQLTEVNLHPLDILKPKNEVKDLERMLGTKLEAWLVLHRARFIRDLMDAGMR
ncbi:uncharacterized protein LOC133345605 [Lethenteron reissneri]|uniref:uncharacterized protein LOC133345605 n=1 Tax=Lethenteron reissneri TaxID=7753 RepID=UPI002AB6A639|nr:uncharacterized protein LOC133345605 [Lethenteron reissneri]XP_061412507.1 uncharacterized protein LOC133345605 [Lethenteron reissneri]